MKTNIEVEKNPKKIEVKGFHEKINIKTKDPIKDEQILVADIFNKHYPNILEETSGIVLKNLRNPFDPFESRPVPEITGKLLKSRQHH